MSDTHGVNGEGWIGFDLDGTLAKYDGWQGIDHIGEPIEAMVRLAKKFHAEGKRIKILTARVAPHPHPETAKTRYPLYAGDAEQKAEAKRVRSPAPWTEEPLVQDDRLRVKKVEFREATPYWLTRIANWTRKMHEGKTPVLEFQSGYGRFSPRMAFIAGRGEGVIFARLAADDPVQHRELSEFPKARYALFIGERIVLQNEQVPEKPAHARYQR